MGPIHAMPADSPSGPAGSVGLAEFTLGGQRYMAIEAGPLDPLWAVLKEDGSTEQCGWLKDRWGSPGRLCRPSSPI